MTYWSRIKTSSQFNEQYVYTSRGNRKSLSGNQPSAMKGMGMEYDVWNQLANATTEDGQVITYLYNGDGCCMSERSMGSAITMMVRR